ncbi:MAG TPA: PDZ domain-containing protein, partial [Fimbriimonas sp.]
GNVTEINFEKKKFIFHPSSVDITKRKPDGKRTFLAKLLPVGADSMEIDVALKNGKKLAMALDTGNAFFVTTHKDSLERVGEWEPGKKAKYMGLAGVASGPVDTFYKRMEDTVIFGVPVKSSVWDVIDLPSSDAEADGTVGFQFLKNFNIVIDYERRRVWLDNFTGSASNEEPASVGISGFTDSKTKRVVIARVSPDSPAEAAGIKAGDHLLAIGDRDLTESYSFRAIQNLVEGEKDSLVKLAVSRNGQLKRYELKRIPLVN